MLAKRVFDNAADPTHFIDPDGVVPSPFVPRGNIKGRAEVIWLPLKRFGTKLP